MLDPRAKRVIPMVSPEKQNGNIEYKRQLHKCTLSRLEKLKTQMSYRLDEGNGVCHYWIGVEDDGCHSLMDYSTCTETAKVLERIARSLNAIVVERRFIQGEIFRNARGDFATTSGIPVSVVEHPLFDRSNKMADEGSMNATDGKIQLVKEKGVLTRAEITIQRVETHELGPSASTFLTEHEEKNASKRSSSAQLYTSVGNPKTSKGNIPFVTETLASRNLRVAVMGNVDAGKSTLIGTLTLSLLDDGRGSSRTTIMKHRHEIESGRTSTVTSHIMGFKESGEAIAGRDSLRINRRKGEDEVVKESFKVVTLMDLAGHEKYLKTTIHGVASGMADYALILVNSRQPPTHMTHQHLNLCVSFGIQIIIVFTKVDGCSDHAFKTSKQEVFKMLRRPNVGKRPFEVRTEKDLDTCIGKLNTLAPVISTSCVTGEGIDLLKKLLFTFPKRRKHEKKKERPFEFLVDDTFNVPGVGPVVSGFVNAGSLTVGTNSNVYVGPLEDGSFIKTVAKSAHVSRISTNIVTSGQSACIALALSKDLRKKLRRGMVVSKEPPQSTKEFEAEICVLKGEGTTIRQSYQAYVHILNVRQSAIAKEIMIVNKQATALESTHSMLYGEENEFVLRPGCRAKVRFEFAQRPEYVRPGMRMLFRDGRVRGVGLITGVTGLDAVG
eukprot:Nitzschia sp. Nitz4//scaffold1_size375055//299068//301362//NITZ4_000317-RA/size375055-augustus-gene-0.691-mRNA-1//1//CDS//3329541168//1345//frame0